MSNVHTGPSRVPPAGLLPETYEVTRCRQCGHVWLMDLCGWFRCPSCLNYDGDSGIEYPVAARGSDLFWRLVAAAAVETVTRWGWPHPENLDFSAGHL